MSHYAARRTKIPTCLTFVGAKHRYVTLHRLRRIKTTPNRLRDTTSVCDTSDSSILPCSSAVKSERMIMGRMFTMIIIILIIIIIVACVLFSNILEASPFLYCIWQQCIASGRKINCCHSIRHQPCK